MRKIKAFIARYQHHLSIGSFLVGFTVDTIILKRIDLLISNLLLYTYLAVVIVMMVLLHYVAAHPARRLWWQHTVVWFPFIAQFAFGGMFSGFLIFYSQSGSVITSWPFLLLLVGLVITNEFMRKYHTRLAFQTLLLFFCLFSFAIYTLPILMGRMGEDVFELSGFAALFAVSLFVGALSFVDYHRVKDSLRNIILGCLVIYGFITALYFSNVLPPIPLALKSIGVYHSVVRSGADYLVTEEPQHWYGRLFGSTVHMDDNDTIYAFSSVFAPTSLSTLVVHEWQYYDPFAGWITESRVPFPINGGRDGGYRGYTANGPLSPGMWRVNVETERGQLIGRITFTVVRATSTPATVTRILR